MVVLRAPSRNHCRAPYAAHMCFQRRLVLARAAAPRIAPFRVGASHEFPENRRNIGGDVFVPFAAVDVVRWALVCAEQRETRYFVDWNIELSQFERKLSWIQTH
jgi:hypothetical protein